MTLREQWSAGQPTLGVWLTMPGTVNAETAARVGFDYVCVDTQHGAVDYQLSVSMMQAILLGGGTPIVRVPWNEPGIIGKMLDAGAQGVIVPMVNSREEAERVVQSALYPPLGTRSYGPVMALPRNPSYPTTANDITAVIPMIETVEALNHLDDILSVDGVHAIYVGPADLSLSLGLPPGNNDDRPEFTDALITIVAACRRHGVVPGMHTVASLAARRLEQGFQMLTISNDLLAMRSALVKELAEVRGGAKPAGSTSVY
jgi:4-hydroxy-2-oxoheptanedioate aldolase